MILKINLFILFYFFFFSLNLYGFERKDLDTNRFNPHLKYKTIVTDHFEIHYPEELQEVALKYHALSEKVYSKISQYFGWELSQKTHIVLSDKSDQPSLFTISFPHKQIQIDVTLPPMTLGLNEYGDWHEWLLTHEFVHIYQMDRKLGIYAIGETLMGSTSQPNMVVPNWFKEGVSVELETKMTNKGRARGSFYEMIIRKAVYENKLDDPQFVSLDNLNTHLSPHWPWTIRAYLFGSYLVEKINNINEKKVIQLINEVAQSVPLNFEKSFKNVMDISLDQFWDQFKKELKIEFSKKINKLLRRPLTPLTYLTHDGYYKNGLVLSQDGKRLFTTEVNPFDESQIVSYHLDWFENTNNLKLDKKVVLTRSSGSQISVSKSERYLVFDESSRVSSYLTSSDAIIYDQKGKQVISASLNLRIRDIEIHPDGKNLLFVQNENGKNKLVFSDTEFNNQEVLIDQIGFSRISTPRFNQDGSQIVLTIHNDLTGGEDLVLLTSKGLMPIVSNGSLNLHPSWVPNQNQILFSSDMVDNVFNLYLYDLDKKSVIQLTHVIGGLFDPVISHDKKNIFSTSYRSNGYDIVMINYNDLLNHVVEPSKILSSTNFSYIPNYSKNSTFNVHEIIPNSLIKSETYKGINYLLPQYLSPSVRFLPNSSQFGFSFGSVDPLFFQHYELTLRYDTSSNSPVGRFYYYNGISSLSWDFEFSRDSYIIKNEITRQSQVYKKMDSQLGVAIPLSIINDFSFFRPHLDLTFETMESQESKKLHYGGGFSIYYDTEFTQIGLSFPEYGSYFEVGQTFFIPHSSEDSKYSLINLKLRTHKKLTQGLVYHPSLDSLFYTSDQKDDEGGFGVGGVFSFPIKWNSDINLYGYPTNYFYTKTAHVFTHKLITELRQVDSFFNIPLYLEKMSLSLVNQLGAMTVDEQSIYPWSLGLEIYQDFTIGHLFQFKGSLGLYTGNKKLGGMTHVLLSIEQNF